MIVWLLEVVKQLQEQETKNAEDNGRRMASIITLVSAFYQLIPPLSIHSLDTGDIEAILYLLCLWPDPEHSKCADLDVVLSLIPGAQRKAVSDAIIGFCNHLLHQKLLNSPYWLFVVPLVHFLRGTSKPFQKPELDPQKMVWSDRSLGLNHVRKETNDKQIG